MSNIKNGDAATVPTKMETDTSEEVKSPPPKPQATPKSASKKRTAKTAEDGTPTKKTKAVSKKIGTTPDEITDEERMLVEWKDAGRSWPEIMTEWENITGAAPSSRDMLRKRYPKLKAALSVVKTEHISLLMQAKSDADERIDKQIAMLERKRWETVAEIIKELGGDEYPSGTCEKTWKQQGVSGTPKPTPVAALLTTDEDAETGAVKDEEMEDGDV
ncbi:hypothetical protein LTS18_008942 [Coniosporium uncinatum]|uniref:Uncharacterized protein n=1 Tax=Coniosporium uncinatum TaxID=93489 RepID=A0ACC3DA85_9PEZI|nr:hypothetical protein LTS18_008942 [Coniosporium uncinatum]